MALDCWGHPIVAALLSPLGAHQPEQLQLFCCHANLIHPFSLVGRTVRSARTKEVGSFPLPSSKQDQGVESKGVCLNQLFRSRSKAMNEQPCGLPQAKEGAGKTAGTDHPECVMEPSKDQEEPCRGMQQHWEAQQQEFLNTLQRPHSARGNLADAAPWDDAKAFLASFEQVAAACRWPKAEWVARLLPALSGEAQQAFSLLSARDKADYSKVKAAILRGEALRRDKQRQHFREFCCQELGDPQRMYSQLQELCCQWLEPERHTKEQILELLVLEQFLASLPMDVQSWVQAGGPESGAQAVALLEDFLLSQREADTVTWQEPLQEWAWGPLIVKEEPSDMVQGEISKEPSENFRNTQQNINGEIAVPDNGTRTQLKVNNHQFGRKEPEGTPRMGRGRTQENMLVIAEVQEEKCKSNRGQEMEPLCVCMESGELTEDLAVVRSNPSPVNTERGEASFSKYGKRYHLKSAFVFEHCGEECNKCPSLGEEIQSKSDHDEHHISPMEEKNHDFPKSGVRLHSKAEHQIIHAGEKIYKCPDCRKSFSWKSELLKHEIIHRGEKPHHCPECGKKFAWKSAFLRHQSIHTGKKPHLCLECGKSYSQRSILFRHQEIHTEKKPHKCPECGKKYSHRSSLLMHQSIHTGDKLHKCHNCGKNFFQKSGLLRHQSMHTGEKPHKCHKCEKSFFHRSGLLRHQNMHTGEKPHKCLDCGKSFSQRCHLSRHAMIHTGKKPDQYP